MYCRVPDDPRGRLTHRAGYAARGVRLTRVMTTIGRRFNWKRFRRPAPESGQNILRTGSLRWRPHYALRRPGVGRGPMIKQRTFPHVLQAMLVLGLALATAMPALAQERERERERREYRTQRDEEPRQANRPARRESVDRPRPQSAPLREPARRAQRDQAHQPPRAVAQPRPRQLQEAPDRPPHMAT